MKNFHLPLPEQTYDRLRAEADRSHVPATSLAREAIDMWLKQQARKARHAEISAYADEAAGSLHDLDPDLESAGLEQFRRSGEGRK
jgi:hypothetical protein